MSGKYRWLGHRRGEIKSGHRKSLKLINCFYVEVSSPGNGREREREKERGSGKEGRSKANREGGREESRKTGREWGKENVKQINGEGRWKERRYTYWGCKTPADIFCLILWGKVLLWSMLMYKEQNSEKFKFSMVTGLTQIPKLLPICCWLFPSFPRVVYSRAPAGSRHQECLALWILCCMSDTVLDVLKRCLISSL